MNDSTWTWMSGSTTHDKVGVYGNKGNASGTNVPGSRRGAVAWFDSLRQEFWLFGGHGYDYSNETIGLLKNLSIISIYPYIYLLKFYDRCVK